MRVVIRRRGCPKFESNEGHQGVEKLARRLQVLLDRQQSVQLHSPARHDHGQTANPSVSTNRQPFKGNQIVTDKHGKRRPTEKFSIADPADLSGRPFHRLHYTLFGQLLDLFRGDVDSARARDVIQHYRKPDSCAHSPEMIENIALRRPEAIGWHDHEPLAADRSRIQAKLQRSPGAVLHDSGQDWNPVARFLQHRIQNSFTLGHGERQRLSRTAQGNQTIDALRKQEPHKCASSAKADAFVLLKRGDGGGIYAPWREDLGNNCGQLKPPHEHYRVHRILKRKETIGLTQFRGFVTDPIEKSVNARYSPDKFSSLRSPRRPEHSTPAVVSQASSRSSTSSWVAPLIACRYFVLISRTPPFPACRVTSKANR